MFGYIVVHKPELKFKEYDIYRSYYCGLCRSLKTKHGLTGQLTLSYDMTFLVMLLTSLYEPALFQSSSKCIVHPLKKQNYTTSVYSDYVANMNLILSYYKCVDDWQDEHKIIGLTFSGLLKSGINRLENDNSSKHIDYAEKINIIKQNLELLSKYEKAGVTDIDTVAGTFGNIMSSLFAPHHDEWEPLLSQMGFFLGKFIYILDAYDDLDKDIKNKSYNPFISIYKQPDFSERIMSILKMMMAESARAFEMLPIIDNVEILRNILYAGVWQNKALQT